MNTWIMVIDVEKCENCNNCFLACKDEHCGNQWPGYSQAQPLHGHRWIDILAKERGRFPMVDVAYLPKPCMHCQDAPCTHGARNGAVYRREDGIVIIDPQKAGGRKDIVKSCPYGAIWWNEELNLPQKCTFCAHLLDGGWKAPRCVQACPTGALTVDCLDSGKLEAEISGQGLQPYAPGIRQPVVYYKNLYRFASCFVSGTVAVKTGSVEECAAGAVVSLLNGKECLHRITTDDFGEFKFDGLEENSGPYAVEIAWQGKTRRQAIGDLTQSRVLETVWL